jgi:hypothetical protein
MKAKYYANSFVLEAKLGNKPSFAWRSILRLCELLKEGLQKEKGRDILNEVKIDLQLIY